MKKVENGAEKVISVKTASNGAENLYAKKKIKMLNPKNHGLSATELKAAAGIFKDALKHNIFNLETTYGKINAANAEIVIKMIEVALKDRKYGLKRHGFHGAELGEHYIPYLNNLSSYNVYTYDETTYLYYNHYADLDDFYFNDDAVNDLAVSLLESEGHYFSQHLDSCRPAECVGSKARKTWRTLIEKIHPEINATDSNAAVKEVDELLAKAKKEVVEKILGKLEEVENAVAECADVEEYAVSVDAQEVAIAAEENNAFEELKKEVEIKECLRDIEKAVAYAAKKSKEVEKVNLHLAKSQACSDCSAVLTEYAQKLLGSFHKYLIPQEKFDKEEYLDCEIELESTAVWVTIFDNISGGRIRIAAINSGTRYIKLAEYGSYKQFSAALNELKNRLEESKKYEHNAAKGYGLYIHIPEIEELKEDTKFEVGEIYRKSA